MDMSRAGSVFRGRCLGRALENCHRLIDKGRADTGRIQDPGAAWKKGTQCQAVTQSGCASCWEYTTARPTCPSSCKALPIRSHQAWDLIASDDGSTDDSPAILRRFGADMALRGNRVELVEGPRRGFAANFLSLIARSPDTAEWLAISDQDDVWLPERLARGIAALAPAARRYPGALLFAHLDH